jgi:hypothetical protein
MSLCCRECPFTLEEASKPSDVARFVTSVLRDTAADPPSATAGSPAVPGTYRAFDLDPTS